MTVYTLYFDDDDMGTQTHIYIDSLISYAESMFKLHGYTSKIEKREIVWQTPDKEIDDSKE